jgi:hypothetical protein
MYFDAQLIQAPNHTADVMAEHVAQQFVDLSPYALAANRRAELRLDRIAFLSQMAKTPSFVTRQIPDK